MLHWFPPVKSGVIWAFLEASGNSPVLSILLAIWVMIGVISLKRNT